MPQTTPAPLDTRTKVLLATAAAAQMIVIGVTHADISRRDGEQLYGSKGKWRMLTLISPIGPTWYFLRGRR